MITTSSRTPRSLPLRNPRAASVCNVHVRDRLKSKLDDLLAQGLISLVAEPTPWVSNLVIVDKPNGDLRLCLDPKSINKTIQREHYPTPTLDEVTTRLSEARIFFRC